MSSAKSNDEKQAVGGNIISGHRKQLAASSEKSSAVDYEALRKKFKEARLQAGLTKHKQSLHP